MGVFDKLKFWKKEEPFPPLDLGKGGGLGMGAGLGGEFGGMDQTAGLGGTESLGPFPSGSETTEPSITITGKGFESGTGLRASPLEEREGYARPRMTPAPVQDMVSKDIEIVSAKLDSIRAGIESLSMRMSTLEQDLQRLIRKGGW